MIAFLHGTLVEALPTQVVVDVNGVGYDALLAFIDRGIPKGYNARTFWLIIIFAVLVYLVSPLNPMPRKERQGLLVMYPPIIFIYWFFFQVMMMSLNPSVHYYLGPSGLFAWVTNSLICLGFGAIFSKEIITWPGMERRLYGTLFFIFYLFLFACFAFFQPPVMST